MDHEADRFVQERTGGGKLKERNPKWINDDYVKFIRMAEALIEKNGQGVLGFITNHGYLDNPTFRGMRWHLLQTFDKIYVFDLHGNSKKKEVSPDGTPDKNVFDIQQGVAIIVGVKTTAPRMSALADVFHRDLWGDRKGKYNALWEGNLATSRWAKVELTKPSYPLMVRDYALAAAYGAGMELEILMPHGNVGLLTARDHLTLDINKDALRARVEDFQKLAPESLRDKYALGDDVRDWKVQWAKDDVQAHFGNARLVQIAYRPFDPRWTFYTGRSRGFHCYPRSEISEHYLRGANVGLLTTKSMRDQRFAHAMVVAAPSEVIFLSGTTASNAMNFPLYLYPAPTELDQTRRVNFEPKLYAKLRALAAHAARGEADEVAVFDYIYGVLHCPAYRAAYAEFLKIDFPRVPWPASPEVFWDVSDKGGALRRLHLMEAAAIGETPHPFVGEGAGLVEKPEYRNGAIWINKDQRFENAPEVSWGFYIGGYQPAQKWLKDRKGRTLDYADVQHYQRILKILTETDRIMRTIEMPLS